MRAINRFVCRVRLEALFLISIDASDQGFHAPIEAGFTSESICRLFEPPVISATVREQIIPYKTLTRTLTNGTRLTAIESDRLLVLYTSLP
jgi:hypothetical protein